MSENKYFKSIDEKLQTPAFKETWGQREFAAVKHEGGEGLSDAPEGISRREFVKMAAGGLALLGLTGCRRPEGHIVPMNEQPENRVVGNPIFYATSEPRSLEALPLIAETHEGRPTKLEGNSRFAAFGGATDAHAQAYVLDLYDPDRATKFYKNGAVVSRSAIISELQAKAKSLSETQGEGAVVVAHPTTSPTTLHAKENFLTKYPKAKWIEYSAFDKNRLAESLKKSTGKNLRVKYKFEAADRILSLDCDFLSAEIGAIAYARAFAARRRPHTAHEAKKMNRLYVVESSMSLTGAQADHRMRLEDRQLAAFAAQLLNFLEKKYGVSRFASMSSPATESRSASMSPAATQWLHAMAEDLWDNRGRSLVNCGGHQSEALQLLVVAINELLNAEGNTLEYMDLGLTPQQARADSWSELEHAQEVIVFNCNPAYDAPDGLKWAWGAARAKSVTRYYYRADETTLTLPKENLQILMAHGLESWGVGAAFDGTVVAQQPLIEPLFGGLEVSEFFGALIGESINPRKFASDTFVAVSPHTEMPFDDFLNRGVAEGTGYKSFKLEGLNSAAWTKLKAELEPELERAKKTGAELIVRPSYGVGTGELGNSAWMQECPDPMTKLTWGNALLVSPKMAARLGYTPTSDSVLPISAKPLSDLDRGREKSPIVLLQVDAQSIKIPLVIQPGMADDTMLVNLGYGHTKFGRNADNVGVNVFPLVAGSGVYSIDGVSAKLTTETMLLASTQNHWSIEGREHYREGDKKDFVDDVKFAQRADEEEANPPLAGAAAAMSLQQQVKDMPRGNSAYEHPKYTAAQQWGLSIDLSSCTGCNACVIACQSENNIPTVGKDQMLRGREMHWIRIDRYYASGNATANHSDIPSDVDVGLQPMTCQHCERAPCEQVCPVNATIHDESGLNVMAYNRCVGTRYCANNCPYKVRRFNFFDYAKRNRDNFYWGMFGPEGMPDILKLQKNPDVTIRSRGVMEKCTMCVQRIESAKIRQRIVAKDSGNVNVADGIIKTACQQVCPSNAIVFGDVADAKSLVSQLKASPRDYSALGYLNTRPRLTYLARIRNQNRAMPDYRPIIRFRAEQGEKAEEKNEKAEVKG